jgi:hypothetical protein
MMKHLSFIAGSILLSFAASAQSATLVPASCSSTAVQAAINSAASGDTVLVPGPCTINGDLSIPNTKGIVLDGQNATLAGRLDVVANATVSTRVTRFTFTKAISGYNGFVNFGGGLNSAPWRLDHCTFPENGGGSGPLISIDISRGVIDHCTFAGLNAAQEYIHIDGYGAGSTAGWTNAHTPGSNDAIYFEDNTFTQQSGQNNCSWIQAYYGARFVMRFNQFNFSCIDNHGTPGMVGGRWWEIYKNNFNHITSSDNITYQVNMRAGSGVIFGNVGSTGSKTTKIGLCEEDSGYPALYQIGRGQNQALTPAYIFGNTTLAVTPNGCDAPEQPNMVQANRDFYQDAGATCSAGGACTSGVGQGTTLPTTCSTGVGFWKTDAGGNWDTTNGSTNDGALYKCTSPNTWTLYWVPLTYPHPLISGGLAAPANLRIQ